jgi:hypothetical protein
MGCWVKRVERVGTRARRRRNFKETEATRAAAGGTPSRYGGFMGYGLRARENGNVLLWEDSFVKAAGQSIDCVMCWEGAGGQ